MTPNTFHFYRLHSLRLSFKLRIDSLELSESSYNSLPLILLVKTMVIYNINSFSLWKESALWDVLRKKKNGLITQDREKFEQLPEEVNHLFRLVENCSTVNTVIGNVLGQNKSSLYFINKLVQSFTSLS